MVEGRKDLFYLTTHSTHFITISIYHQYLPELNEWMNECLTTPQHEKQIGYWVSEKGIGQSYAPGSGNTLTFWLFFHVSTQIAREGTCCHNRHMVEEQKDLFYLTTHSTHFITISTYHQCLPELCSWKWQHSHLLVVFPHVFEIGEGNSRVSRR